MSETIASQTEKTLLEVIKDVTALDDANSFLAEENTKLYKTLNNVLKIIHNDEEGVSYNKHYLLDSSEEILDDLRKALDRVVKNSTSESADVWKLRFETTKGKLDNLRKAIDNMTDALINHTSFRIEDSIDFHRLHNLFTAIQNKSDSSGVSSNPPSEDFRALSESIEQLVTRLDSLESKLAGIQLNLLRGKYQERLEALEKQNR